MALFDDDPSPRPQGRRSRRERIGWTALAVAVAIGILFALLPSPYVIEQPGPVYDTLGTAEHDGEEVPLIEIPDAETFPTDGELNLLTVTVRGRPGQTPNWLEVVAAWFDRTRSAVPVEAVFPPGVSDTDRDAQNEAAMVDSPQDAIAAALVELGYEFPREVTVAGVVDDSPAAGVLEEGDVIVSVDGIAVNSIDELRAAVRDNGADEPASLLVLRDGAEQTLEVTPVDRDGTVVLGVGVRMHYVFPIDVVLQLDNVGGPSAGMMFALGIVDKLNGDGSGGDLTGGRTIAGTGTIDADGTVGAVGGVPLKTQAAKRDGATVFLVPEDECSDAEAELPKGRRLVPVTTLKGAVSALVALETGTGSVPSC